MLPRIYFERLVNHEGGYVNDPNDKGGETKYGISKRAFPKEDIKALTKDRAYILYEDNYWAPIDAYVGHLPNCVKYVIFDYAVNSGLSAAFKALQLSANVNADGVIGPLTIAALKKKTPVELINGICDARKGLIRHLVVAGKLHRSFELGIVNRIERVRKEALSEVIS